MAKLSQQDKNEAFRKSCRELYAAVDARQGDLTEEASQTAFLREVIQDKTLQKADISRGALVPHTDQTLRQLIRDNVRKHGGSKSAERREASEFWTAGSAVFTDSHLRTIGMKRSSPAPTQAGARGSINAGSNTIPAAPKRKFDDVSDSNDPPEEDRAPKTRKITHESSSKAIDRTHSAHQLKRSIDQVEDSDERNSQDQKRMRTSKPIAAPNLPSGSVLGNESANPRSESSSGAEHVLDTSGGSQSKMLGRLNEGSEKAAHSTEEEQNMEGHTEDVMQEATGKDPVQEEQNAEKAKKTSRDDPRAPSWDDFDARRSKAPLRNVQEKHAKMLAAQQNPDQEDSAGKIFPPEVPTAGRCNGLALEIHQSVMNTVRGTMDELSTKARNVMYSFCFSNDLSADPPAEFLRQPTEDLDRLYRKILASGDWRSTILERQNQTKPWNLTALLVVESMIAAEVYEKVFLARLPWDIEQDIRRAVGDRFKFGEETMDDRGYKLDSVLKAWTFKMMDDKDFQAKEVAPYAKKLAAELAMTLTPHLKLMRQSQRPEEERYGGPSDNSDWIKMLERVFEVALIMKGKIETYPDTAFEYTWPESGSMMERESAIPVNGNFNQPQLVLLTLWPGIRVTEAATDGGPPTVRYQPHASVYTRAVQPE